MTGNNLFRNNHRGLMSLYSSGMVMFFSIAIVMAVIIINVGFSVTNTQKQVVIEAIEEVDEHLIVAGKISGAADAPTSKLVISSIPIKTVAGGSVDINPNSTEIYFELAKNDNVTITHDNIYSGALVNSTITSVVNAVTEAKNHGLINSNPYDDEIPTDTQAFVYWIINSNFDLSVDEGELAALAIVYAENDRPVSSDKLLLQANVPAGYILKFDKVIPSISGSTVNFGGIIKEN